MAAGKISIQANDGKVAGVVFEDGASSNVTVTVPKDGGKLAADSLVVHKTGDETIAGVKTFSDGVKVQNRNVSPFSGFKNYIINGNFNVWQRGTSFVADSTNPLPYTADRWRTAQQFAVGALTVLKSTLSYGGVTYNSEKIVASTAVVVSGESQCMPFYYKIEGSDAYSLNGKPFTVSFLFNTNVAGTYPITFTTSADGGLGNNTYCTTFNAVSGVQKITITIPAVNTIGYTNGYGLRIIIGSVSSINTTDITNTWLANSHSIAHLANSFNWAGVVGNYIEIAQVQLEEGSVATPFENRPYGLELSLCQRYYEAGGDSWGGGSSRWSGYTISGVSYVATTKYKVRKRISPTIVLSNEYTYGFSSTVGTVNGGPDGFAEERVASITTNSATFVSSFTASAEL